MGSVSSLAMRKSNQTILGLTHTTLFWLNYPFKLFSPDAVTSSDKDEDFNTWNFFWQEALLSLSNRGHLQLPSIKKRAKPPPGFSCLLQVETYSGKYFLTIPWFSVLGSQMLFQIIPSSSHIELIQGETLVLTGLSPSASVLECVRTYS